MKIRAFRDSDTEAVVQLSIEAWAPVFESIRRTLPEDLFALFYGDDWRETQGEAVAAACNDTAHTVAVAEDESGVIGFVVVKLVGAEKIGEIYMIATSPASQGRGIGSALTQFALERMRHCGIAVAMVETGGDPGHAAARGLYERAGFSAWPAFRYFKALQ